MSVIVFNTHLWECDTCHKREYAKQLPQGWVVLDKRFGLRDEIGHKCTECVNSNRKAATNG